MVNNENDKKDNENPEIQEITTSGDNLENNPKDDNEIKNEEPNDDSQEEIMIPEIKVEIQNIEENRA